MASESSPHRRFDMRELMRVGLWGLAACGALTLAAAASWSDPGMIRLELALANLRNIGEPPARPQLATAKVEEDAATRRLFETVQMLTADRERLMARIDALQRNFEDLTGSITRAAEKPADPAPQSPPAVTTTPSAAGALPTPAWPEPPAPLSLAAPVTAPATTASTLALNAGGPISQQANVWPNVPVPRPAPPPPQTQAAAPADPVPPSGSGKQEFGIDLGVAPNAEGLRALWTAAKARHGSALEGLRPIMVVRERGPGNLELRLVVGPLPSAAAAARLCAMLGSVSATCQPALFEGQRLALR